jgi:integrase
MYSESPRKKASAGTVQVRNSNGRLQLRFSYQGVRHCLSLGLDDTPANRKAALAKAKLINTDITEGCLDQTLVKYKPSTALSLIPTVIPTEPEGPNLQQVWEGFLEFKRPQISPNTAKIVYGTFSNYVKQLPTCDLSKATEIRNFAIEMFPLNSTKRFIQHLGAACEWAVESGKITANPFKGMAEKIKLPKSADKDDELDIDPFEPEERDAILEALQTNQFCNKNSVFPHSFYYSMTRFLFITGCRPSEMLALQWRHITPDCSQISFEQVIITGEDGKKITRDGLKTQERRRFPCNRSLRELLISIRPKNHNPESPVFPGIMGGILNWPSYRKNVWTPILKGLGLKYRKPYQMRHTFITLALRTGKLEVKDVARLVGNSPEIIYRHYLGNKRELFVPEF